MAGTYTTGRKGLVSKSKIPTTFVVGSGASSSSWYLPANRDLDVTTGQMGNLSPGSAWLTSPRDTVTSWRSGGKWDSVNPDRSRYVPDLLEISRNDQADRGHEFNSVKQQIISFDTGKQLYSYWTRGSSNITYSGEVAFRGYYNGYAPAGSPYFNDGAFAYPVVPDVSLVYGTKAIAKSNPTAPNASLMTALIELRDGLPKFPGVAIGKSVNKKELLRAGSDEFLNYVFGITPTVKDMKDFLKSIVNLNKIVSQYNRDADKLVRRRFVFPTVVSNGQVSKPNYGTTKVVWFPGTNVSNYYPSTTGRGDFDVLWSKSDKIWFSGAFRYHLPVDDNVFSNMDRLSATMNKLFGSNLDAASIWAALPWSWLVDWFVDVGDIIRNGTAMSQYQGLMQYGYLMCDSTYHYTYTVRDIHFPGGYSTDLSTSLMTKRKQRRKATPFGFGLNPNTFSDQQWAILGALGLSKGPKSLW